MTASVLTDGAKTLAWWRRPSLSRRIAIAMIFSLVAIQGQAFLQIRYLSEPELRLIGTRWLAEATARAASETFALPPQQRDVYVRNRADKAIMQMAWSPTWIATEDRDNASPVTARLQATLVDILGDQVQAIRTWGAAVDYRFPTKPFRLIVVPEIVADRDWSRPVGSAEPDVLIPAGVKISVQGLDGSWLTVEPIGTSDGAFGSTLPYVPLLIGGLIIALVSTLTARHLMAPLDILVVAADRVGKSREPVTVPTDGLHEFAAVARAFEDMQHRLLRIVDERTEMLAAISHDLRSALTRLRLATEDVQGESERHAMTAEIEDMQAMVDSTLAFASGEARAVPNQLVDVASLLISLSDEAADAGDACTYDGPDHAEVVGHPIALKRAFRNLIDNAIKYGDAARISLSMSGERIGVQIEDDGPGIPMELFEEAAAPFRRLDSARTVAGVGLGLTIARDVFQAHGGVMSAERGTRRKFRITVELPHRDGAAESMTGLTKNPSATSFSV